MASCCPLYEGDTILLSCFYAKGYVFSLPPSSSYSSISIYPQDQEETPNVHTVAFQVLPEYAKIDTNSVSPLSITKEDERPYLRYKLVYGRKIKLLHVASKKYISLPERAQNDNDTKPAFLDSEPYLFRILPASNNNKTRGDTIMSGDEVKLESVVVKGQHILCVRNAFTGYFELKMAVTNSVFSIVSQTACDCLLSPNSIRGGSVVRFGSVERDAYLCGAGSTVAHILPPELDHDSETKVYFKKKKPLPVPRPPPVAGDCYWQLVKCDNPLDGSAFKIGEKCHIRHLLTQKYIATTGPQHEVVTMASISEINTSGYNHTFYIRDSTTNDMTGDITKGSVITISDSQDDTNCRYLTLDEKNWKFVMSKAIGTKMFSIQMDSTLSDASYFKIDEVKPDYLHQLYFIISAKTVLMNFLQKLQVENNVVLDELIEVLGCLLEKLQHGSAVNLKKYIKMFRVTHCADLLVSYLNLQLQDVSILRHVCKVLEAFALIKSPRSHWYLAKKSFLNIYFRKLGQGVGVEEFLAALVKDESAIAQSLVDHFVSAPAFAQEIAWKSLDACGLRLLSTLCFIDGHPEQSLQNVICQNVIAKKGKIIFFSTEHTNDQVYVYSPNSTEKRPLSSLCPSTSSSDERKFQFFVAQLSLFSKVCKGMNKSAINVVRDWFPFEQALLVLKDPGIHSLAKSAYLEIVISVYLDESIAESGVDIDSIWTCYLWERLAISTEPDKNWSCQSLEGSNVKQNLVDKLQYSEEIKGLLNIIKDEIDPRKVQNLFHREDYDYLNQLLAVLEPMIAYGFCWNVKGEATFSIQSLVNILTEGKRGTGVRDSSDEEGEEEQRRRETPGTARTSPLPDLDDSGTEDVDTGRFLSTTETIPIFNIKTRTLQLLRLFFKQFIYLTLEQFLYEFRAKKDGTSTDYLPAALLEEDITDHLIPATPLHPSLFYQITNRNLRKHFEFTDYRSFDVKKREGQALVRILQRLMRYDNDELRTNSAALLYDLYSKEQLVFAQAELSYIVDGESCTEMYHDMVSYGAFNDEFKMMNYLLQGRVMEIEEEAGVQDILEFMVLGMIVGEDETEINSSSQNIAFTTGVFASLMNYVLKFSSTYNDEQKPFLVISCKVLQIMCRANPRIQKKIVESFSDFMKVKTAASSVARLLTEVFTNNEDICLDIIHDDVLNLYKLACSFSNKEGEEEKDIEHMEFFTTLEAIMMTKKLTGNSLKPAQNFIIKLFNDNNETAFGQLFLPDDEKNTISTARKDILEKSADTDIQLLKLLHVTSLLATCCNGPIKSSEDICRDIFTLEELVDIVTNGSIPPIRKIPFARLLSGAYLSTERESIYSLHLLAQNLEFWNHIHAFTGWIEPLSESLNESEVKPYLRKVSQYYQTWNETFSTEGDTSTLFLLRYFIEGLGPLLTTFCTELASYKNKNLTKLEYGKIINPRGVTLQELGSALVGLISGKEQVMLTNQALTTFWKNCINSIENVLPESPKYHEVTQDYHINDNFDSDEVKEHNENMKTVNEINCLFQQFIANYRIAYEWINPTKTIPPRDLRSCNGLMPRGASFKKLINRFDVTIDENEEDNDDEEGCVCKADVNSTCVLLDLLEVLYRQLHHPMTSKDKAHLRNTLAMTLQLLFGIIYTRSEEIDDRYWQTVYGIKIKPLQIALTSNKSTIGVHERCIELVLNHLLYHDDSITVHILALLYTLVFNGNSTTQNIVHSLLVENTNFFLTLQRLIWRIVFQFGGKIVTVDVEHTTKRKGIAIKEDVSPLQREYSQRSPQQQGGDVHVSMDQDDIPLVPLRGTTFTEGVDSVPSPKEETMLQLSEGDKQALDRVGVVLDLTSALCDGQNRKLQTLMREQQEDFSMTSINIISGTAALLQTLAELPSTSKVSPDYPLIIETMTKSIQALIEMCAGNFINQRVALDGQVVDSINSILSNPRDPKYIDAILMQCKAIELLQVLIEETDTNSKRVVQSISKDLKKRNVINFIKDIYVMDVKGDENFKHTSRGLFQAYHSMRSLAESEKKSFGDYAGLTQEEKSDYMWKHLNYDTGSIEVNYITKEGKEILTQVYFPLEESALLTDDEKSTMQSELNRDSLEDKARDLLEWTESVWKNYKHKKLLRKYHILQPLMFFSTIRHWFLVVLTILLNIFVLGTYQIPSIHNCAAIETDNNSNATVSGGLVLIPRPWECWSSYHFIVLYILGTIHVLLAVWMMMEYYIREAPNFVFTFPYVNEALYKLKVLIKESSNSRYRRLTHINDRFFYGFFTLERPTDKQCFDTYFFGLYSIYRVLFVISSIAAITTYGYFYCICLPYIFIKVDVILHVIRAVAGKAKQLIFVALLILTLLLMYAVLSFAIMSNFFDLNGDDPKFCRSLWECYITVIREGLLDSYGGAIPVKYVGQTEVSFNIYLWRSIIDLSYFVVVSVVALEVITAILVDRFSEIRAERDAALKDQRDLCYVCGIASDVFEREGAKGKGFWEHYHEDHNVYNYIYYALYIRSMPEHDHNAIEKYVFDKMKAKSIDFYPLRKAKVLGGSVNSNAAELVDDIKGALEKYEGQ